MQDGRTWRSPLRAALAVKSVFRLRELRAFRRTRVRGDLQIAPGGGGGAQHFARPGLRRTADRWRARLRPSFFPWTKADILGVRRSRRLAPIMPRPPGCYAEGFPRKVAPGGGGSDAFAALKLFDDPAVAVVGNIMYVIGGSTNSSGSAVTNTVWAYNPRTGKWSSKALMPTARASAVAIVESKVIYVIGGWNGIFSGPSLTTVEGYNPATDTWTEEAPLLVGKWGASRPAASTGIQSRQSHRY